MREILFRGKRVDNGEWIVGYHLVVDGISYILPEGYFLNGIVQVDITTVGQYTGLWDKNGAKIFEGDVVKIPTESPMIAKVICPIGDGVLYEIIKADDRIYHKLRLRRSDFNVSEYEFYEKCIEVIGNIFDNPKLWEEE